MKFLYMLCNGLSHILLSNMKDKTIKGSFSLFCFLTWIRSISRKKNVRFLVSMHWETKLLAGGRHHVSWTASLKTVDFLVWSPYLYLQDGSVAAEDHRHKNYEEIKVKQSTWIAARLKPSRSAVGKALLRQAGSSVRVTWNASDRSCHLASCNHPIFVQRVRRTFLFLLSRGKFLNDWGINSKLIGELECLVLGLWFCLGFLFLFWGFVFLSWGFVFWLCSHRPLYYLMTSLHTNFRWRSKRFSPNPGTLKCQQLQSNARETCWQWQINLTITHLTHCLFIKSLFRKKRTCDSS